MHEVLILAIKAVAGGTLVCLFALISEALEPKRFAGLFSAAPAVAIAGLVVALLDKGTHDARENVIGMLAGCVGLAVYALAVVHLLKRMGAPGASALALGVWFLTAGLLAWPLLS